MMRRSARTAPAHPDLSAKLPPARAFGPPVPDPTPSSPPAAARHDFSRVAVSSPVQRAGGGDAPAHRIREAAREGVRTPAGALPFADRIQRAFGRHPVDTVRAHLGAAAGRSAGAMRAAAFASGEHVVFGRAPDLRTAAHEAAHVVQQRGGARPAGGIGRVGDAYERHADAVADAVVAGRSAEALLEPFAASAASRRAGSRSSGSPFDRPRGSLVGGMGGSYLRRSTLPGGLWRGGDAAGPAAYGTAPAGPAGGAAIQREPTPTGEGDEHADHDVAPGFTLVKAGGKEHEYTIKGSDIRVVWNPTEGRYTDPSGTVVSFQSSPRPQPRPQLELPRELPLPSRRTLPDPGSKDWTHFNLSMDHFKRMGMFDQMSKIAELASTYGSTPFESQLRRNPRNPPKSEMGTYYRYHKFPLDPTAQQMVFGGGINKTEITPEWHQKNLKQLVKTRHDLLSQLSGTPQKKQKAMQKYQANAMSTPFIATTEDPRYAHQLIGEYPPTPQQRAVVLKIRGPKSNVFDFESEFQKLGESGGGQAQWNYRDSATRAKDANQAEFGIPDLFIPMHGTSPLGSSVEQMIDADDPNIKKLLGIEPLGHDEEVEPGESTKKGLDLTPDQRKQVLRARSRPKALEWSDGH